MALFTKKEFADQCDLKTNTLSVYILRKKVIVNDQDLIDTNNAMNKAFLAKYREKVSEQSVIKHIQDVGDYAEPTPEHEATTGGRKRKPSVIKLNDEPDDSDLDGIPQYHISERKLKHLDTVKREKEIEKLKIDIDKKRGVVVPSELIKPVLLRHNQSIVTEFKNGAEEIIRVMSKKKSFTIEETADVKGQLVKIINESMSKATQLSIKAVDDIINDYAESRGVGERK